MSTRKTTKAPEPPTVSTVILEGSVLLSIVRHTSENYPSLYSGSLLGFEDQQQVTVSHAYPFPYPDQYEGGSLRSRGGNKYQKEILDALQSLDEGVEFLGWFQSTISGNFVSPQLVEAVAQQQLVNKNAFILIHNMASIGKEVQLKAMRLSQNFLSTYIQGQWKTKDLEENKLSFLNIFEELKVEIHNQHLVNLFLVDNASTVETSAPDSLNFNANTNITTQLLENLYTQIDSYNFDQTNFNYYQRQLQKEHTKILQWKQARKAENFERAKVGEPELDTEEWKQIFKLPTGPSRLNNTLYSRAIDEFADDILKQCDEELIKSFAIERKLTASLV
ncbi:hypothetical protein PUMCH_003843 [Australozyma saopauloensis]|uniref:Eukaryotic translation initiation factor 3 subunit H n=1 Tax=Australozyma saopauloensis TaxID=291208 RepID=A0AAX4HD08_9ASCO|nr:hypothetical protein PUMCH_003843 [[Candida] saopauloensis]